MLIHLLERLEDQETRDRFMYSVVVVDNDSEETARSSVEEFRASRSMLVDYYVEPDQNIACARNSAVRHARGDFLAFIDDDEVPAGSDWLLSLYETCVRLGVGGVLGPVRPLYENPPPEWVIKGRFYERPTYHTGTRLAWDETRTGNALVRKEILEGVEPVFDARLGSGGEDKEFFYRMMKMGHEFCWCDEAPVYELIRDLRFKRMFMIRRALLRGRMSLNYPISGNRMIVRSLIAVVLYTTLLPWLLFLGHHVFMRFLVKDFDHIGRLLAACGVDAIKEKYVSG